MSDRADALISRLKDGIVDVGDGQMTEIIRSAREEALVEAKAIIKDMMVTAILEQALRELGCPARPVGPDGAEPGSEGAIGKVAPAREATMSHTDRSVTRQSPSPSVEAHTGTAESRQQIQQEIEALRRKIAENEKLLTQVKTPPVQPKARPEGHRQPEGRGQVTPAEDQVSTPREEGEESCGYYVYGIVKSNGGQPIDGLPETGIDPAYPVYSLSCRDIQAIVSRVSLQEFGQEELEARLNNLTWLKTKVQVHQDILETVLAGRALVPMRFCIIYQTEQRVQEILTQYYADFVDALTWLEDKKEWGCKVYCDRETLTHRVGEISDRVKELRAEMDKKSGGAAYFLKKKLDEVIAEEVERIGDDSAQRIHDLLSGYAEESVVNSLQSKELTGRKEEMVLNGAYLVSEEQLPAFRAKLESLAVEYGVMGFSCEVTGPWPPYNFVKIGCGEGAVPNYRTPQLVEAPEQDFGELGRAVRDSAKSGQTCGESADESVGV
jgi:hypothetical protein